MADIRTLEYANCLSRLIQAKTVSRKNQTDITEFYQFHDLLRSCFPHVFSVCEYEDFSGSFLLRWKGRGNGDPILLMNHHDVVEASGNWTYDAFSGQIADGKLWGRGTLDTKGGLWAMLQAADELAAQGFVPNFILFNISKTSFLVIDAVYAIVFICSPLDSTITSF